jgi:hypothetical protein
MALAERVYRTKRKLTVAALSDALTAHGGHRPELAQAPVMRRLVELLDTGWCLEGAGAPSPPRRGARAPPVAQLK